jgi:PAS domain S-box-containing protein
MSSAKDFGSLDKTGEATPFPGMVSSVGGIHSDVENQASDYPFVDEQASQSMLKYAGAMKYMVGHAPEAFWQMDRELKFTYTNTACEKISGGFRAEEFVGRSLLEFLTPEGIEDLRSFHTARQSDEKRGIQTDVLFYELQMRRKDGSYFWAGISSAPMRDASGQIVGYQGIMRDISSFKQHHVEQKRLEDLLGKTEKMAALGYMAGSVAHELNNMLAGILGYSELLMLQDYSDDSVSQSHLRAIIENGENAVALLQDVLMMSRKEAGIRQSVQLNDLIPQYMQKQEFQNLMKRHKVAIRLDLEVSLRDVVASASRLEKVVANLLLLSIQQAGPGGAVSIATKTLYLGCPAGDAKNISEGEYVVVSVTDTGAGIPDEAVSHIFEPFYFKKIAKFGATGLELVIVREVVKDHDGFIDVHSTTGSGTTFTIYLPVTRGKVRVNYHMMSSDFPDGSTAIN